MKSPTLSKQKPSAEELAHPAIEVSETEDLVALAERFVAIKRRLGHRYRKEAKHLHSFLRFLGSRDVATASQLSVRVMLDWAAARFGVHPLTWNGELSAVSIFMDHLRSLGRVRNNICWFLRQRYTSNFRPYIFSREELHRIFFVPPKPPSWRARAIVYFVLYACALRVSEGCRLRMRHLDAEKGTLFIQESKWFKDRLLPLAPQTLDRLRRYVRDRRGGAGADDPLFVKLTGEAYDRKQMEGSFTKDLRRLRMYRPTHEKDGIRYGSTRLHSLRHSFAIHRLLKWYREGADVQAVLPLLSTYLGHSDVRYSQVYLKATGLLLREAHERFAGRWEKEFPLKP